MSPPLASLQSRFIHSIQAVDASAWDALCPASYPFARHAFLSALENSGSCSLERGWQAQHLLLERNGELVAALPGYLKYHSYGEYVFDWAWADASQRLGQDYYPKLISAIPFTPCSGPRLLLAPGANTSDIYSLAYECLQQQVATLGLSGWHCLFPSQQESQAWAAQGAAVRIGCQFHWFNRQYQHFDEFLDQLQSRKRKSLRKERQQVAAQGIRFEWLTGDQLTPDVCAHFYQLYRNTYRKRSGHDGYLTPAFFQQLCHQLAAISLLVRALDASGKPIAAALFFYSDDTLFGRYWGCEQDYAFLHFETCYYQGIEFAIARGLARFDGGAQGEHKLIRGFEPQLTYSNHWLADTRLHQAVRRFVQEEALQVQAYQAEATSYLPYKCAL